MVSLDHSRVRKARDKANMRETIDADKAKIKNRMRLKRNVIGLPCAMAARRKMKSVHDNFRIL